MTEATYGKYLHLGGNKYLLKKNSCIRFTLLLNYSSLWKSEFNSYMPEKAKISLLILLMSFYMN